MNGSAAGSTDPDAGQVDSARFRQTLSRHAAGVTAVTALVDGRPVGLTATSFTSVSADPPLVSFYVADTSSTWVRMRRADRFAVHLLADDQGDLATRFATQGIDRFAPPTRWTTDWNGPPILAGTSAHLVCHRHTTVRVADHWLVVGRVAKTSIDESKRPLLYLHHTYGRFTPLPRPD
nr:flavin reductase family protein [Murinocardiopsis flavida]